LPSFSITLAYDGTEFVGWQRQANGASVQGVLEAAAAALDERPVTVIGAGRTDAGVHALGQVAAFTLVRTISADILVRAMNARLPETVRVLSAAEVPRTFHPQFDAHSKTYRYRIWNADAMHPFERRYAWHVPGRLDVDAMRAGAQLLEGEHDFAAFQGQGSDVATTVRVISASQITTVDPGSIVTHRVHGEGSEFPVSPADRTSSGDHAGRGGASGFPVSPVDQELFGGHGGLVCYEVTGSGFLRHMVRTIVGSLVEVGRGRQPAEWLARVIASRDRSTAGQTAPANGLFLVGVSYGGAPAGRPR
jgi:tRNA pseudouridine38-40 synthase